MQLQPDSNGSSQRLFCDRCAAATSEKTPGDVSTINGIGRKFYGSAEPCVECASVIRTLWWTLVDIPILPLGSYRYKTASEGTMQARFWCRKLPGFYWAQVLKTWIIGLVVGAAAIYAIYLYHESKRK